MKKILTAAILSTALLINQPIIAEKINFQTTQTQQKHTYNLEGIAANHYYDNKSFKTLANIDVFEGFDKINQYEVEYTYITDWNGKREKEVMNIDNLRYKDENAAPVYSMFGEKIPVPEQQVTITQHYRKEFSYYNDIKKYLVIEDEGEITIKDYLQKGKINIEEAKKEFNEYKQMFKKFKKILDTDKKIEKSQGYNNFEFIKNALANKMNTNVIPHYYKKGDFYTWMNYKDTDNYSVMYEVDKNFERIRLYKRHPNIDYFIYTDKKGNVEWLEISKRDVNKTTFYRNNYIKDIYTQAQIDEMFSDAKEFYDQIKEYEPNIPKRDGPSRKNR